MIYTINSYVEMLEKAGLLVKSHICQDEQRITNITYNSKEASSDSMFVCKGAAFKVDYLASALENGAVCYVSEDEHKTLKPVSYIIVSDVRKAMAYIADMFYEKAFEKLNLVGITGTKGKSTTAYYIKYIIDEFAQANMKKPSGIVSSIDTYDGKELAESRLTTPEAFELHRHFANAVNAGIEYFEMEVSSQALKYDRVLGVTFDIGVFLNISEDHISASEHSDLQDYLNSKLKLFSQSRLSIVNLDTDSREQVLSACKGCNMLTFGLTKDADFYGYDVKKIGKEINFKVRAVGFDEDFVLTMPGLFNVENALAAIAVCTSLKIPLEYIKSGLKKARSSGRMEIFHSDDDSIIAIVDYAHNKLSFTKLYQSIKAEYQGREIITVFGCPGGKAYNRRMELGELSGKNSSRVYLTAEDPSYEEVSDISADIASYVKKHSCECYSIDDRGEAIMTAITNANKNSIVLITGKGNETRQKVKSEYVPCPTDADYVKQAFEKLKQAKI